MNRHALECEAKVNNRFMVAQRQQELDELKVHLQKIKGDIDK